MVKVMRKIKFSVGVCAYNEEKNIGKLLKSILAQKLDKNLLLEEIIVVASGCTDKTEDIVREFQKKDDRIKLFVEKERRGKVVAVNKFLREAKTNHLILESADTLPVADTYSQVLEVLGRKDVGMVGVRVVPLNSPETFMGFCAHLLWDLHHKINLQFPERAKMGELVAFKRLFRRIPPDAVVDEASIEPLIHSQGYKVSYCPRAIIYNKAPETIRDFIKQRRRNYAGHTAIRTRYGYTVVTYSNFRILGTLIANIDWSNWRFFLYVPAIIFLEGACRLLGLLDFKLKARNHTVWKMAKTTKNLDESRKKG